MTRAIRIYFIVSVLTFALTSHAQSRVNIPEIGKDPRGEVELVVCSQNLHSYGTPAASAARNGISQSEFQEQEKALVVRFGTVDCDVVAVQEILARNEESGKKVLRTLADILKARTGRFYDVAVGSSSDPNLRNGYLVAKDRAEILNMLSYTKVELPKISAEQKPRLFTRGPYEIQIQVKPRGEDKSRTVTLVNMHFKSKAGAAGDPTGLEWETYRMEMAEGLRRIIESRHKRSLYSAETPLIVLGDRNANFDLASAKILEGSLSLEDFKSDGNCRLSKRGVPLCKPNIAAPQLLFSVLTSDPEVKNQPGTFQYKNVYSWIDDILLPADTLRLAWTTFDTPGNYDSGVVYEPSASLDHAMTYVRLNW